VTHRPVLLIRIRTSYVFIFVDVTGTIATPSKPLVTNTYLSGEEDGLGSGLARNLTSTLYIYIYIYLSKYLIYAYIYILTCPVKKTRISPGPCVT